METRKIEVIKTFKEGYETFTSGDIRVVESSFAERVVGYGWAVFVDGGPDVPVVGTPDNPTLKVSSAAHRNITPSAG
jgi:hypothetical protein